jgi:farnesyl-diphosphate farnesyltransferase
MRFFRRVALARTDGAGFIDRVWHSARVAETRMENPELLARRLKATSRSFYLTLRVLPRAIRPQIGLAYLLARTTDTIADTEIVPLDQRLAALQQLRGRILGHTATRLEFGGLAQHQALPAEKVLLEKVEESLAALQNFSAKDRSLIHTVLDVITSGQELDLRRFAGASAEKVIALETDAELDDYTYRVAGCVGEFWTSLCLEHLFRLPELEHLMWSAEFEKLGVRFGKGLQLVNILRDLPADLKKGRCYLPREKLKPAGLSPENLLSSENGKKFLRLFRDYLDRAEAHLTAGWEYTNRIPFTWLSLRLACAWPILIGVKTIARLRAAGVEELQGRVKISRGELRGLLLRSVLLYPFPGAWRNQFAAAAKPVASGGKLA